jgi:hypothetical protein
VSPRGLFALGLALLAGGFLLLNPPEEERSELAPEVGPEEASPKPARSAPHLEPEGPAVTIPPAPAADRQSVATAGKPHQVHITGRLVDQDNRPLVGVTFQAALVENTYGKPGILTAAPFTEGLRFPITADLSTNANGDFQIETPEPRSTIPAGSLYLSVHTGAFSGSAALHEGASKELGTGAIVVQRGPLLVAGHVLSPEGHPLPNIRLRLDRGTATWTPQSGHQRLSPLAEARTDDWGAFQFFRQPDSEPSRGPWKTTATWLWFAASQEPIPDGTDDLVLTLARLGGLDAWIAMPRGRSPFSWHMLLLPAGEPAPNFPIGRPRTLGAHLVTSVHNTLHIHDVTPGWYDLHIYSAEFEDLVLTLGGLEVPAGACEDPRLKPIDIVASIPKALLHVTDSSGQDLDRVQLSAHRPSHTIWPASEVALALTGPSPIELPVFGGVRELIVASPGYRTRRLQSVTSDRTIVLESGLHVTLEFDEPPAWKALPAEYTLHAQLSLQNAVFSPTPPPRIDQGPAELAIGGPGTYKIELILDPHDATEQRLPMRVPTQPETVEIAEDGQLVRITPLPGFFKTLVE